MMTQKGSESNEIELVMGEGLREASRMIDEAMNFTKINPTTAPVRFESAKNGVKYSVYTSLGLTGIVGFLSNEFLANQDPNYVREVYLIKQMAKFEASQQQIYSGDDE